MYAKLNIRKKTIFIALSISILSMLVITVAHIMYSSASLSAISTLSLLTTILAYLLLRQEYITIRDLKKEIHSITESKDYSRRITIKGNIEIGKLSTQFNHILNLIEQQTAERNEVFEAMQNNEHKFKAIFDQTFQLMGVLDTNGILIEANSTSLDLVGLSQEDVLGTYFPDGPWWSHSAEAKELITNAIEQGRQGKFSRFSVIHVDKNGNKFDVDFSLKPFFNDAGEVVYLIPEGRDITELKKVEHELKLLNENLEERVARRTEQLQQANNELEAFSYSVSHDLRAPLRAIDGFAHALIEDYSDILDETGQDYLKRVRNAAQKLGVIIDEMLRLSKVSITDMKLKEIDLGTLARSVFTESTRNIANPPKLTIVENIFVSCDENLMKIALENLISNAVKYSAKSEMPSIEFGKTEVNGETTFFIKDNGVGFDNKYSKKLFTAFQRLHSDKDFSGTGVGLSIVKRVISRHGGEIYAESKVNNGATFYFTLNAKSRTR